MDVSPIGVIIVNEDHAYIDIDPAYQDGLHGLEGFSHIVVVYWLDRNDNNKGRATLQVHPRGDSKNPLTGVFATHSPKRPNPLAITVCELVSREGCRLEVSGLDAFDGSPVVDVKCYIDWAMPREGIRMPDWV